MSTNGQRRCQIRLSTCPLCLRHGAHIRTSRLSTHWREVKDAADLALIAYWYAESEDVQARLYATSGGQETLLAEELDVPRAAARLLGDDLAATIGPDRTAELLDRWPGDIDMLVGSFSLRAGPDWPGEKTDAETSSMRLLVVSGVGNELRVTADVRCGLGCRTWLMIMAFRWARRSDLQVRWLWWSDLRTNPGS
jgi:hypothetical protein